MQRSPRPARGRRVDFQAALAVLVLWWGSSSATPSPAADVSFQHDVQPLLQQHCYKCHGEKKQQGGLRFDVRDGALRTGESGATAIVPGKADSSELLRRITSRDDDTRMPPRGEALTAEQVEVLRRWIQQGARWPVEASPLSGSGRKEIAITDEDRKHWAFRPLRPIALPAVKNADWCRTPVDHFVLAALEEKNLSPSPPAEPRTLIRRLFFDLIGLPPRLTAADGMLREELLGIEIDPTTLPLATGSFTLLVDRLLASPHHAERWARHWLDIARYADSDGQEGDADRPHAYHFRDFVIRALQDDLPYNTFVRWQLAGDEIAPDDPQAIAATGFIVAGNSTKLNVPMEEEKLRNRANELDDMVSTTSQALLGLTLACARCHDHKYDPLPTRDYYRMLRVFNSGDRTEVPLATRSTVKAHGEAMTAWQAELDAATRKRGDWLQEARAPWVEQLRAARIAKLPITDDKKALLREKPEDPAAKNLRERHKKELQIEDAEYIEKFSKDQKTRWDELDRAAREVAARKPTKLATAFAFADFAPEPRETWFFERGDFMARNERMDLGFLSVLTSGKTASDYWNAARESKLRDDSTQQRRALADWITDVDHGAGVLLARVMVNRVWQHHFGEGLVRTVSDFGTRGEAPTHPDLLEWLTGELVRSGWSLKHLHRLVVNSATYRQGTAANAANAALDPDNRLLWRRRPRRLESEVLRDSMLAVAGSLNLTMFGPSFKPPIADEAMQARNVTNPYPRDVQETSAMRRRSIYLFHKRVVQYPLLQAFDAPDAQVSCGRRTNTTVAPQALALLNDPFVRQRAGELASRLQAEAGGEANAQIRRAFQLGLGRDPSTDELNEAQAFVVEQSTARRQREAQLAGAAADLLALTDFCQMLLALNEFAYVD